MKKMLPLLLAALMSVSLWTSCAPENTAIPPSSSTSLDDFTMGQAAAEPAPVDPVIDGLTLNLFSDWSGCLKFNDLIYGDMLWALSYIEEFMENPTWDNLQIARTALAAAEESIRSCTAAELSMTTEDYLTMVEAGYDVSVVEVEAGLLETYQDTLLLDCMNLRNGLYSEIFWQPTFDALAAQIGFMRKRCETELCYLDITTEFLIVTMNNAEKTELLRTYIADYCPALTAQHAELPADIDALYTLAAETIDTYRKTVEEESEFVGDSQALAYRMEDIMAGGDTTELQKDAVAIEGLPLTLPWPGWDIVEADYAYYYFAEDGSPVSPAARETLTAKPDQCAIVSNSVREEDFLTYIEYLDMIGVPGENAAQETGTYSYQYLFTEYTFVIEWKNETVSIYMLKQPFCFAPEWYLLAQ